MSLVAYLFLVLVLLCALGGSFLGVAGLWRGSFSAVRIQDRAAIAVTVGLTVASIMLLQALAFCDFSVSYVANYTDRALPLFYRLTAFWAGQAGSLLFWALMVALCGSLFTTSTAYRALSAETRMWYQTLFLGIMALFALLLCTWNNPFEILSPAPADGGGLNPLLQNPGMIIHPPLLFLGYGGFVIPGCLAVAQALAQGPEARAETSWLDAARPFTMTAWLFLTAGIVIGAWWAYMELGWGGYWAWDPVENASLIPWLVATAALHTGLLESRRGKLRRVNVFLMALTTVSAFFATYLVRGNVVESVHAFGEGGVGPILLTFVLVCLFLIIHAARRADSRGGAALEGLETREGFLVMTAWLFLFLSAIILTATLWPVWPRVGSNLVAATGSVFALVGADSVAQWFASLAGGLTDSPSRGLEAGFYNRVCLPLFTVLTVLLAFCPWLGWRGGLRDSKRLFVVLAAFVVSLAGFWWGGFHKPLALMAAAGSVAALVSVLLVLGRRSAWKPGSHLAAWLVHLGLALIVLGVAFSGPYKTEVEVALARGETTQVGPWTVRLKELYEGHDTAETYRFLEAELELLDGDEVLGTVGPQRRIYAKFDRSAFSEAATRPSLGREFYAVLLGLDQEQRAVLSLSSTPLVNWLWIGGLIMTLAPLLGLRRRRDGTEQD